MAEAILTATAVGRVKAKAKAKAMATLMVTAMAKEKAKSRVTARAKAKVKARDRRREGQFAAPADSVANAWSRARWAARSVAAAVGFLLHRDLERFPLGLLLLLHHFAGIVRSRKRNASHRPWQTARQKLEAENSKALRRKRFSCIWAEQSREDMGGTSIVVKV
jgi:hypothetical protein